jgi:RNA recognition motif-containing protein
MGEEDADYAIKIMNMIKLYGKPIKVNKASANEKNMDVGANLFVGNLDSEVDEKLLFDTFSAFGVILQVCFYVAKATDSDCINTLFCCRFQRSCATRTPATARDSPLSTLRRLKLRIWH